MFDTKAFNSFLDESNHRTTLQKAVEVQQELNRVFYDQEAAVRAVVLAALSGEPCLLVGPPGTAKSLLIRRFCGMAGIRSRADEADSAEGRVDYFEYLLTPFTEPTELFGTFRFQDFASGRRLEREDEGMLHKCQIAFLDEVFNGSSAILNALLSLINERIFHDRGIVRQAPLQVLFGATNSIPSEGGNSAIYDRFTLRARVANVPEKPSELRDLLKRASLAEEPVRQAEPDLLERFAALRTAFIQNRSNLINMETPDQSVLENLNHLISNARDQSVGSFSNRRIVRMIRLMAWSRLLRAVAEGTLGDARPGQSEYDLVTNHMLDAMEEPLDVHVRDIFDSLPHVPKQERPKRAKG